MNAVLYVPGVFDLSFQPIKEGGSDGVLGDSEVRLYDIFANCPVSMAIYRADDRTYVDANVAFTDLFGWTRAELIGHTNIELNMISAEIANPLRSRLQKDGRLRDIEVEMRARNAEVLSVIVGTQSVQLKGVLHLVSTFVDITARKRADSRFRRLVDSRLQGVMFWNKNGQISDANDLFLEIIGYSRADLESQTIEWKALTPPEFQAITDRAGVEMRAQGFCTPFEKEYIRKDGSRVPVLLGAATFEDNPAEGVAFALDLTERKKLEQQFLRAQRMEGIGTLAGGIAHDLNNVLAPILLAVDVLHAETRNEEHRAILQTLHESAVRGSELVQQVLSFARGVEGRQITINPIRIVRDLLKVMRDTLPKSIDVRFVPPQNLWTVTGDPSQVHQIFMNLCVNARDAMPNGGKLTISLQNAPLDDTYAAMSPDAHAGDYVKIQIADTGVGIAPTLRNKIFEPFFTTKELGKGTGLGLATTAAIVKSHGGFINVYSEPGDGATFNVYLPANRAEIATDTSDAEPVKKLRGNGQLILVVDDEEALRKIARMTLERSGYRVLVAANGAEAVALYAVHRTEIAVVLTDMAMPVMDGPATIVALKAINANVKIIASSGFTSNVSAAKASDECVVDFIPKPYTAEMMLAALDKLM